MIKALKFTMTRSVSTPFELRSPVGSRNLITKSSELTVEGDVVFYASKFSAKLPGGLPVTFTPSFPPPLLAPLPGRYTDCTVELVFVRANVLNATALDQSYSA